MRTDGRISDDTFGRALACHAHELGGFGPNQQHLVEPRTVAHDLAAGIHRPSQHRRATGRNVLDLERDLLVAVDRDEKVSLFGPLIGGLGKCGAICGSDRKVGAEHRDASEHIAPRRSFDAGHASETLARSAVCPPGLAHQRALPSAAIERLTRFKQPHDSRQANPIGRGRQHGRFQFTHLTWLGSRRARGLLRPTENWATALPRRDDFPRSPARGRMAAAYRQTMVPAPDRQVGRSASQRSCAADADAPTAPPCR